MQIITFISSPPPCSSHLSATSQQYFSFRKKQLPATNQQYFSLKTNQHQPLAKLTSCSTDITWAVLAPAHSDGNSSRIFDHQLLTCRSSLRYMNDHNCGKFCHFLTNGVSHLAHCHRLSTTLYECAKQYVVHTHTRMLVPLEYNEFDMLSTVARSLKDSIEIK
jgi:hypothetical protein